MANPYTSGQDMNPFAEDLQRGEPKRSPTTSNTGGAHAAGGSATTSPVARPDTPPKFYNPSSSAEAQGPQYNPDAPAANFTSHDDSRSHTSVPVQQNPGQQPPQQPATPGQPGQPQQGQQHQAARDLVTAKFWTLEFYQQFFDVSTRDVLRRMGNVLIPFSPPDFLQNREWHSAPGGTIGQKLSDVAQRVSHNEAGEKNADLYGPFWLCTTLWITIGIVGNFVSKMAHTRSGSKDDWHYDFKEATVACVTIYAYTVLVSALVWGLMKWKAVPAAFQDVLCVYGYSMFLPFIAAILCGVPNTMFQLAVCLVCGVWSTFYLLANFWRLWRTTLAGAWFTGIVALVVFFQVGLTLSLKFYFFNYNY
eukprot:CAMPEP_0174835324 /NCGR_PEP_ID=MMETSP1114-20130205/5350_1 /TAXON_ID=312471 /ORGANISM="Neobodo designis, Strain CCAP 1951/1" /LENGTH=362 /DNA_ID=CAMNT_0016069271 /DNA_START=44 /DNA_END=1132 /DNA_ORIENTATION=+